MAGRVEGGEVAYLAARQRLKDQAVLEFGGWTSDELAARRRREAAASLAVAAVTDPIIMVPGKNSDGFVTPEATD